MNKLEIKKILMSMRTIENDSKINNILGKIDLIPDEKLDLMVKQVGDDENSIKSYFEKKLAERQRENQEEHMKINDMITCGTSGNCIHLHMPIQLKEMISKIGMRKTFDTVKLNMLDAIEKIRQMQKDGFYKFQGKDSIYMISPLLIGHEMKFFDDLDFDTATYRKRDLRNEEFVKENREAQLAKRLFGTDKNVGTAKIDMDIVNSEEWQAKRKQKVKEFEEEGVKLQTDKDEKE